MRIELFTFEAKILAFFSGLRAGQIPNYKVRCDYRLQRRDGSYIRILHQVVTIEYDDDCRLYRTLIQLIEGMKGRLFI